MIRRLAGLIFMLLGLVGLALCVAGIVGLWQVRPILTQRGEEVGRKADKLLSLAVTSLRDVQKLLIGPHAERGVDNQHGRRTTQIGHVGEIAQPVVARLRIEHRREHVRGDGRDSAGRPVPGALRFRIFGARHRRLRRPA